MRFWTWEKDGLQQVKAFIVFTMYHPQEHPASYFSNSSSKNPRGDSLQPCLGHIIILPPELWPEEGVFSFPMSGPCAHPWSWKAGSAPSELYWLVVLARWLLRGEPQDLLHSRYLPIFWDPQSKGWDDSWTEIHMGDLTPDAFYPHSLSGCGLVTFSQGVSDSSFARWGVWTRWFWWPHPVKDSIVFFTLAGRIIVHILRDALNTRGFCSWFWWWYDMMTMAVLYLMKNSPSLLLSETLLQSSSPRCPPIPSSSAAMREIFWLL